MTSERPLMIYDGDCGFCQNSLSWLKSRLSYWPTTLPWQLADLPALGLTKEQCTAAMQWIDESGRVYAGARAFARLFARQHGAWKLPAYAIEAPLVGQISRLVYRCIARNRHRLPGATQACSLNSLHDR